LINGLLALPLPLGLAGIAGSSNTYFLINIDTFCHPCLFPLAGKITDPLVVKGPLLLLEASFPVVVEVTAFTGDTVGFGLAGSSVNSVEFGGDGDLEEAETGT